jgi:hypothetical protein
MEAKTVAIFAHNVFYIHFARAWFNLRGYDVKVLDTINDELRQEYHVLEDQLWDDSEFKDFLNG